MVARLPCHYATSRIARTATHGGSCKRQLLITKCNVQNYRLLLWFDKFENLLLNACPSYEAQKEGSHSRSCPTSPYVSVTQLQPLIPY